MFSEAEQKPSLPTRVLGFKRDRDGRVTAAKETGGGRRRDGGLRRRVLVSGGFDWAHGKGCGRVRAMRVGLRLPAIGD